MAYPAYARMVGPCLSAPQLSRGLSRDCASSLLPNYCVANIVSCLRISRSSHTIPLQETRNRMSVQTFQAFRSTLTGQSAIRAAALTIATLDLYPEDNEDARLALFAIESLHDAPRYDIPDNDLPLLLAIVRHIRQTDCILATIATDNSALWDTSREDIDTELILSDSDRHNIGISFSEYREDLRRIAANHYRKQISVQRAEDAGEWAVSEAYDYAIQQVGRGSLDSRDLCELRRWCGLLRSVRGRYFDTIAIVDLPRDDSATLESVIGRSIDLDYQTWTGDQLDYVIGIDDTTPEWVIDTISALLALPDGTNEEQSALLKLNPAAYRKRLQRTREYFAARG